MIRVGIVVAIAVILSAVIYLRPDPNALKLTELFPTDVEIDELSTELELRGFDTYVFDFEGGRATIDGEIAITPPSFRANRDSVRGACETRCTIVASRRVDDRDLFLFELAHVYEYLWAFRDGALILSIDANFLYRENY